MDARADLLAAITCKGDVYIFHLHQNRYSRIEKAGHAATAATFGTLPTRQLFVGLADGSIRAYDVTKAVLAAILREHHTPVTHLAARTGSPELMSIAADGIILWDTQRLHRLRSLGNGPYGAVHALYTPGGMEMIASFQDGSMHLWSLQSFTLQRTFTFGPASVAAQLPTNFCLSPDGLLLVACGPQLPMLLVFSVLSGQLLHGVRLPTYPQPVQGAFQVAFLPDSRGLAALCVDGVVRFIDINACTVPCNIPPLGGQPMQLAGCSFSMDYRGNALALLTDGKVLLYQLAAIRKQAVLSGEPAMQLQRVEPENIGEVLAEPPVKGMVVNSEPRLSQQQQKQPIGAAGGLKGAPTPVLSGGQHGGDLAVATAAAGAAAGQVAGAQGAGQASGQVASAGAVARSAAAGATGAASNAATATTAPLASTTAPPAGSSSSMLEGADRARPNAPMPGTAGVAGGRADGPSASASRGGAQPGPSGQDRQPEEADLGLPRLRAMLKTFGEYPARYRLIIWDRLLQLPHNSLAFQGLVNQGPHPCTKALQTQIQHLGRPLTSRLTQVMSQLAHWCPVYGEASFVPQLVFPFVKLFVSSPHSAQLPPESCFELVATLLGSWAKGWFDRFPHPPVGLLVRMQDLLKFHDAPLAQHLDSLAVPGGYASLVWPMLNTALSDHLPKAAWLRVWDHCFTEGPDFLYCLASAYFIQLRNQLLALVTGQALATFLAGPPAVDLPKLLATAGALKRDTPEALLPAGGAKLETLTKGAVYGEVRHYPVGAVKLFTQERAKAIEAEAALARRRKVVAELELRGKTTAVQASQLEKERAALSAAQAERREQIRRTETAMAAQLARLDDRAKEEKMKQILVVEAAYQQSLEQMRADWQREVQLLRADVQHKQDMLAYQAKNKEEEEALAKLEFQSRQRMWELQQEAARDALQASLREEAEGKLAELQARQDRAAAAWEEQERARRTAASAEAARSSSLAAAAEAAAAQGALRRELLAATLDLEDRLQRAGAERRLRHLAEDQAALTVSTTQAERQQAAARTESERAAMAAQAQRDAAWYEGQQRQRELVVEAEKAATRAALERSRRELMDTEAQAQLVSGQAALLERRRALERQNLLEELEARRALEALALERSRGAAMSEELRARRMAAAQELEAARKVAEAEERGLRAGVLGEKAPSAGAAGDKRVNNASGGGGRPPSLAGEGPGEEGGSGPAGLVGVAEALAAAVEAEERELRQRHERALEVLAKAREAQLAELELDMRTQLQAPVLGAQPPTHPATGQGPAHSTEAQPTELDVLRALETLRAEQQEAALRRQQQLTAGPEQGRRARVMVGDDPGPSPSSGDSDSTDSSSSGRVLGGSGSGSDSSVPSSVRSSDNGSARGDGAATQTDTRAAARPQGPSAQLLGSRLLGPLPGPYSGSMPGWAQTVRQAVDAATPDSTPLGYRVGSSDDPSSGSRGVGQFGTQTSNTWSASGFGSTLPTSSSSSGLGSRMAPSPPGAPATSGSVRGPLGRDAQSAWGRSAVSPDQAQTPSMGSVAASAVGAAVGAAGPRDGAAPAAAVVSVLEPGALADLAEQQLSSGSSGSRGAAAASNSGPGGGTSVGGPTVATSVSTISTATKSLGGLGSAGASSSAGQGASSGSSGSLRAGALQTPATVYSSDTMQGRGGGGAVAGVGAGLEAPGRRSGTLAFTPLTAASGSGSTDSPLTARAANQLPTGAGAEVEQGVPPLGLLSAAAGSMSAVSRPGQEPMQQPGTHDTPTASRLALPPLLPSQLPRIPGTSVTPLSEVSSPGDVDALIQRLRRTLAVASSLDSDLTTASSEVSSLAYASTQGPP